MIGKTSRVPTGCVDGVFPFMVDIGEHCVIADGARILSHDPSLLPLRNRYMAKRTRIGDRCSVGYGSIILPGVSIGDGVVIGAGSVVTKDIPDGEVWAGNPARKIVDTATWISRKDSEQTFVSPYATDDFAIRPNLAAVRDEVKESLCP